MPDSIKLRRPWDTSIADCMWLARFTDKARLHLAGNLSDDYAPFFGHKLATDDEFMRHFDFTLDAFLAAMQATPAGDDDVDAWFTQQAEATPERVAVWNAIAFDLGKPGHPMARAFAWTRTKYYGAELANPRVVSVFSGIAWDEGYLADMPEAP